MKVLFLDIDGVCNCISTRERFRDGFAGIDPVLASRVRKVVQDTGCRVVLASTWRNFPDGRDEVDRKVCKTFDVTPALQHEYRGVEIKAWLDDHPEVIRYAIVDDDDDFLPGQYVFATDWNTGITDEVAAAIIDHLNAGNDQG